MDTAVFDGIVREMGEVSTRRSFARLLGGAVALGAGLAFGGESLAKGKSHGKAHAQAKGKSAGKAAAEGKKGKKVTICFQNQTRSVKKQGWQKKYAGATLGPCATIPQQAVCSSWILSGGPSVSTPIVVDDDLQVMLNGLVIGDDGDGKASTLPPLPFTAQVGDTLGIIARDAQASCRSLSPLWLHCATSGQKRQLTPGNNDGCAPGRTPGTFFSEVYTVSL
jgi:hypothetical protein